MVPSKNRTLPLGTPEPGLTAATRAVKLADAPLVVALAGPLKVRLVLALATFTVMADEVEGR